MKNEFKNGSWPVMLTPFKVDGGIDWKSLEKLTKWYIDSGSAGLFANCLSSEMYFLKRDEMIELCRKVVEFAAGKVKVVATGTFDDNPEANANFAKMIFDTGVDAVVATNCKMAGKDDSDDILMGNYERFLELTGDIPLGLYECPLPYHRLLSPQMTGWLAHTGRFNFFKETSRNASTIGAKVAASAGTSLKIFNAHTPSLLDSLKVGASGSSCIAANFYPDIIAWLCSNWHDKPEKSEVISSRISLIDRVIRIKYPTCAKWFINSNCFEFSDLCRSADDRSDPDDDILLSLLAREIDELRNSLRKTCPACSQK